VSLQSGRTAKSPLCAVWIYEAAILDLAQSAVALPTNCWQARPRLRAFKSGRSVCGRPPGSAFPIGLHSSSIHINY